MKIVVSALDNAAKASMIISATMAFGVSLIILADVITRVLGMTFHGAVEYVRTSIILIVFMQLPYSVRYRMMLFVDILIPRIPGRIYTLISTMGDVFGFCLFSLIAYGALNPAIEAWVRNEYEGAGPSAVASWPAWWAIVYGCSLAAIFYLMRLFKTEK